MNNLLSPREKLISYFKINCGPDYKKMFLSKISEDLLNLKLNCYLNSLISYINNSSQSNSNLKLIYSDDNSINIFNGITLLKSYTIENVANIKSENQLGLSLFIDWGYLLNGIGISKKEQLMLVL
ncbi:hypothetical protein OD350_29185 (plasmid) [Clostridium beijerinckii]|uniref:hypothetical protein n=1 Tax=Clostridium beijerinckii TaxID=1520 RepID=UPI0022275DB9|nr:hypothetical protein [Clostridium beijerinckii]UYZ38964.1 hypothetical protein OD350_29185 [Clostridium beijerinckii]